MQPKNKTAASETRLRGLLSSHLTTQPTTRAEINGSSLNQPSQQSVIVNLKDRSMLLPKIVPKVHQESQKIINSSYVKIQRSETDASVQGSSSRIESPIGMDDQKSKLLKQAQKSAAARASIRKSSGKMFVNELWGNRYNSQIAGSTGLIETIKKLEHEGHHSPRRKLSKFHIHSRRKVNNQEKATREIIKDYLQRDEPETVISNENESPNQRSSIKMLNHLVRTSIEPETVKEQPTSPKNRLSYLSRPPRKEHLSPVLTRTSSEEVNQSKSPTNGFYNPIKLRTQRDAPPNRQRRIGSENSAIEDDPSASSFQFRNEVSLPHIINRSEASLNNDIERNDQRIFIPLEELDEIMENELLKGKDSWTNLMAQSPSRLSLPLYSLGSISNPQREASDLKEKKRAEVAAFKKEFRILMKICDLESSERNRSKISNPLHLTHGHGRSSKAAQYEEVRGNLVKEEIIESCRAVIEKKNKLKQLLRGKKDN